MRIRIVNARIWDGLAEGYADETELLIEGDSIVSAHEKDADRVIDLGGRAPLPGFIDAHVHAYAARVDIPFAGLFALDVLFRHTEAFQTYLIASAAIYWNRHSVLAGEAAFADKVRVRTVAPRVFVTVGGDEQKVPDPIPMGLTRQAAAAILAQSRTGDDTRELVGRLSAISGAPRYAVKLRVFEGENHLTVMFPSIMRSLEFALAP